MTTISPRIAANVLNVRTGEGYPAGSFFNLIIRAIHCADANNRAALARAFPAHVAAVEAGDDELRDVLRTGGAA